MSKRNSTKKRFPKVAPAVVDSLFDRDPGKGAYGEWMVRRIAAGEKRIAVVRAVCSFHRHKERLEVSARDLYRHRDVSSVREAVRAAGQSKRTQKRKDAGYTLVYDCPKAAVYRADNLQGMQVLGRDTQWCVTQKEHYKHYQDQALVVFVNKGKNKRDPYSKLIAVSENPININPNKFLSWRELKELRRKGVNFDWVFYDALDSQDYSHGQRGPLQEIASMLVGNRGILEKTLSEAVGGHERARAMKRMLPQLRSRIKIESLLERTKDAAKYKLFNPLSMLDHPTARNTAICKAIWDVSSVAHREALDTEAFREIGTKAAMNVPEIFDAYWDNARRKPRRYSGLDPLLKNGLLTVETRKRLAERFRCDLMHLGDG